MYLSNCAQFNTFEVYNSVYETKMRYKQFLHQVAYHWTAYEIPDNEMNIKVLRTFTQ